MWTEEKLNELLTQPSEDLVLDIKKIEGDIMVLGAGGKMGPTLCVLAKKALEKANSKSEVIAVSRFSDKIEREYLLNNNIKLISGDLLDKEFRESLPLAKNIIYMAGRKFGTLGQEWMTWSMNATLPAFIAEQFKNSNIVVFSSGNIYPMVNIHTKGCTEDIQPMPSGEYAMSCLARERAFEYASNRYGTKVLMYRLNYAVDLRYGVIYDIAKNILEEKPISLRTPCFNCIWQGKANEIAVRSLLHASSPVNVLNVTGSEIISVKETAIRLGKLLGKTPIFEGEEDGNAYLNNASKAISLFGDTISADTLIEWQAQWLLGGGRVHDKPTHFEVRNGKF